MITSHKDEYTIKNLKIEEKCLIVSLKWLINSQSILNSVSTKFTPSDEFNYGFKAKNYVDAFVFELFSLHRRITLNIYESLFGIPLKSNNLLLPNV